MDTAIVAENITKLREAKAWSQDDLARAAKISKTTVYRMERGEIGHIENVNAVSEALELGEQSHLLFAKNGYKTILGPLAPKPKGIEHVRNVIKNHYEWDEQFLVELGDRLKLAPINEHEKTLLQAFRACVGELEYLRYYTLVALTGDERYVEEARRVLTDPTQLRLVQMALVGAPKRDA